MSNIADIRTMLSNATILDFLDALLHCDTVTVSLKGVGATEWNTQEIHEPLAAMHNALPELLDAWETIEAVNWADEWRSASHEWDMGEREGMTENPCLKCFFYGVACREHYEGLSPCTIPWDYRSGWTYAWKGRDAHAESGAD